MIQIVIQIDGRVPFPKEHSGYGGPQKLLGRFEKYCEASVSRVEMDGRKEISCAARCFSG